MIRSLCARNLPLTHPAEFSPAQYNASLQANPPVGVRSGFRRRIGSRAREAVLRDSGPVCADRIISTALGRWL